MLTKRSKQLRLDIIKLSKANGGYHYGGSFSCVEILISLFDNVLKEKMISLLWVRDMRAGAFMYY